MNYLPLRGVRRLKILMFNKSAGLSLTSEWEFENVNIQFGFEKMES